MNWYYAEGSQRKGPFTEDQFQEFIRTGAVTSSTLVWHEGMTQWQPYGQASAGGVAVAAAGRCSQCGRTFASDELVDYEGRQVCAECKPAFLQRLREGAPGSGIVVYAGFWIRFLAALIDSILMGIVQQIVGFLVAIPMAAASSNHPRSAFGVSFFLLMILSYGISMCYEMIMVGRYGATLGKMALRLGVVTAEGERVSYTRALGRYWAKQLSGIILSIGYIMAGFDSQKRALHDMICNTRVIRK